jgi:uncharacterized protein (TIGR02266 family)
VTAPDSSSFARNTKAAGALVQDVLSTLATLGVTRGTADLGKAASSLELADRELESVQARYLRIRSAISDLARALSDLHADPTCAEVCESVARALALLYPVARSHQRQRRQVVLNPSLSPPSSNELASLPPAPSSPGERAAPSFSGTERRRRGRVRVEADVGLLSQSHFYTGLSRDLSRGGLFVATYQPKPPGTTVALYFVLPNGHTVHADGVVAWTSEASADCPPGMGIAFEHVAPEDVAAIEEFCRERTPMYHDSGDD